MHLKKFTIILLTLISTNCYTAEVSTLTAIHIVDNAKKLAYLAKKNDRRDNETYKNILQKTRSLAKSYISQRGSSKNLAYRIKFLTQFKVIWDRIPARLFSDNDINVWSKNWVLATFV